MSRANWVTWRLFFITLPVDVFAVVFLSKIALISFENAPVSILIGVIAHLSITPLFAIASQVCKRRNNWGLDLLCLILLGLLRGIVLVLCGRFFNLPQVVSDTFRIFNSAIAFPTWFIFFTVAIEAKKNYQKEFENLFQSVKSLKEKEGSGEFSSGVNLISAEEMINRIQSLSLKLGAEIQQLLASSTPGVNFENESKKIQDLIHLELRPTSKKLWNRNFVNSPRLSKIDLFRIVLLEQRLPILIVLLCTAPFLFVGITGAYGVVVGFVQTCAATLPVVSMYLLSEKCHDVRIFSRFQANIITLILSFVGPILVQYLLIPPDLRLSTEFLTFTLFQLALWIVLLTFLIGYNFYSSLKQQRLTVLTSFKSLLKDSRYLDLMNSESSISDTMKLSRYLHGEVQAGLTASVLLLQQAAKNDDASLAREALEGAVKILMQNHLDLYERQSMSNEVYLTNITLGWRGIADVSINLSYLNLLDKASARTALDLIGEGTANAVRHGKATRIEVTDSKGKEGISFLLDSNIQGSHQGETGLGTEMFNQLTRSWSFRSQDGHGLLTFTLPWRADKNNEDF